jgi:hypothetical protein
VVGRTGWVAVVKSFFFGFFFFAGRGRKNGGGIEFYAALRNGNKYWSGGINDGFSSRDSICFLFFFLDFFE